MADKIFVTCHDSNVKGPDSFTHGEVRMLDKTGKTLRIFGGNKLIRSKFVVGKGEGSVIYVSEF